MQKRNNLDTCFDSIFDNQLRFQIENKEVRFIQTAIETLVEELIQAIDAYGTEEKNDVINDFLRHHEEFQFVCDGTENNRNILRAGSFYEETKNVYPDEFDYIYVICTLEVLEECEEFTWLKHYFTLNNFHESIKDILTRTIETENYVYKNSEDQGRVVFDGYNRNQGPSSKLTFTYEINENQYTEKKTIDVDIVPAFKVIDKRLPGRIKEVCNLEDFAEEIAATGSYLITNEVSFTGTESRFMRKRLSPRHKQAYRLLKYIFNGSSDGEKLRKWVPKAGISTYMIKVATIHHHFTCYYGNKRDPKPSVCVTDILKEILQFCIDYENKDDPNLKKFHGGEFEMQRDNVEQTIDNIEKMLTKFLLLQENIIMTKTIKSISESILDCIQMQSSTGHISGNSSRKQSISGNSSRRNSISSQNSRKLSRSLTNIDNIGISLDDPFAPDNSQDKKLPKRRHRWDRRMTRYNSDDQFGITVNTHENTSTYLHSQRDERYVKTRHYQAKVQHRPAAKANAFDDTNYKSYCDMSRNKKSRWCILI